MPRKKLTPNAYDRMLAINARVCCVCKRRGIGVNIHHTIRINDQWRICFRWRDGDAYEVEVVDYHA